MAPAVRAGGLAWLALPIGVVAILIALTGTQRAEVGRLAGLPADTTRALPRPPVTFDPTETERRWGAGDAISPPARETLDRWEKAARRHAAAEVGLAPQEIEAVDLIRRETDPLRAGVEAAFAREATPQGGLAAATLNRLDASAALELAELSALLGDRRARALRAAEREAYRRAAGRALPAGLSAEQGGVLAGFAQRRLLFLRMGAPAAPPAPAPPLSTRAR